MYTNLCCSLNVIGAAGGGGGAGEVVQLPIGKMDAGT